MDKALLEILACPKCKGELQLAAEETELRCAACRLAYRIDDGIPILLIDEASSYE
ncbi:MAG: Trm112 family protein [Deltaproteobacteria bacterium]|nr:Trm112 family protein [Deltaproteobacteria bacterium]